MVREKLRNTDLLMEQNYKRKWENHPRTWNFKLEPGEKMLMRQAIPGKNQQRAVGPLIYLRDKVGG